MRLTGEFFRAHDPRWSFAPESGDGAALFGGRFNPIGTPALYLADSIEGMLVEMGHGLGAIFEPLTICTYHVDVDDVVDLSSAIARDKEGVSLAAMSCSWEIDVSDGKVPPSWDIAKRLIASGAAGIRVPSLAPKAKPDMTNLVLWRWGRTLPYRLLVRDTDRRLPKNDLSWR